MRAVITMAIIALLLTADARAQLSMSGVGGADLGAGVPQNGDILLVDNASILLQTDNASFICRAAGC